MRRTVVGLTGGIGSGKSTVSALLCAQGARVIDADQLAHQVTAEGGSAVPALAQTFGKSCLGADGSLDRDHMRSLVFKDPSARERLQAIIHPLIAKAIAEQVNSATEAVVVLDIPLLAESGRWRVPCDWVVVVDCTEATQVARVRARNGWPVAQVEAVIRAQSTRSVRLKTADAVVHNDQVGLEDLGRSVQQLGHWLGL